MALFLQTKLWITDYGPEQAVRAFDVSRRKLGVDYVDLYLLHQPVPTHFGDTVAAYQAIEELLANGRVHAIGVCNFDEHQLADPKSTRTERIVENVDIFDFALSADDVVAIDHLDTGIRGGPDPSTIDPERFPLTIPD